MHCRKGSKITAAGTGVEEKQEKLLWSEGQANGS